MVLRKIALTSSLALASLSQAAGVNLITNGGFETGDLSGWTLGGYSEGTGVYDFNGHLESHSLVLASTEGEALVSQNLSTIVGQEYSISFWYYSSGVHPNSYSVQFGSQLLDSQNDPTTNGEWVQKTYRVVADTTATVFTFGGYNNQDADYVDDFVVQSVPEPTSMVALSLGGIALLRRRRNRRA